MQKTARSKKTDPADPLVQRLRSLARESPGLMHASRVYEAILPVLRDAFPRVPEINLSAEQIRKKMETGVPLFSGIDLEFDTAEGNRLMLELARAMEKSGRNYRTGWQQLWRSSGRDSARCIREALDQNRLNFATLLPYITSGDQEAVFSAARSHGLDPALLWTLAQNAVKPSLRAWSTLLAQLAAGTSWERGFCYVCGGAPVLGELQDNDQVKHLRCGGCGADWRYPRLQCSHCGNDDHNTLGYLYPEGKGESMRVETCDRCKGYLKVISAFTPNTLEMLTVEDLTTLSLDYIARAKGYTPLTTRSLFS